MTEPYYNASYGNGMEGIVNYVSQLTDGMLPPVFIGVIGVIMMYVLSKSEWKMPGIVAFTSFTCLLLAFMFKLVTPVNELFIYGLALLLAISIVWSIISENNK